MLLPELLPPLLLLFPVSFPAATPILCFVSMVPGIMGQILFSFELSKACGGPGLVCADNSCMEQVEGLFCQGLCFIPTHGILSTTHNSKMDYM